MESTTQQDRTATLPGPDTMQAVVHESYGSPDTLELRQVARPVVGDDGVLVRVHAAAVNPLDWHYLRGLPYLVRIQAGLRKPKKNIPGVDFAGRIEAIGKNVTRFQLGDDVFGEKADACAEFVSVPEDVLVLKPSNLTFQEAAAVPVAAFTALQGVRDKGHIQPGQTVLINGASGGVGTFAVQIAKAFGADVTGVCSTRNVGIAHSIGADHVIDYTNEDFTKSGHKYDLIFDLVGNRSLSDIRRILKPKGTYVSAGAPKGNWVGPIGWMLRVALASLFGSQRMTVMLARQNRADLTTLKGLIEAGEMKPVIDRTYPLSETAEAIRYMEEGHAQGKIVITVKPARTPE